MPTYAADQLRTTGDAVRNFVDAVYASSRFQEMLGGKSVEVLLPVHRCAGVIIFQALPTTLVSWAADVSNLAPLVMPPVLM